MFFVVFVCELFKCKEVCGVVDLLRFLFVFDLMLGCFFRGLIDWF